MKDVSLEGRGKLLLPSTGQSTEFAGRVRPAEELVKKQDVVASVCRGTCRDRCREPDNPILGPRRDIPAPDVNTDAQVMAWMADTARMLQDKATMEIVTGKPIPLGGSQGRKEATRRGVGLATRGLLKRKGRQPSDTTVAVQGYGNVGSATAAMLHQMGCKIVAVSDISGGLYNPRGLDIASINRHAAVHPGRLLEGYEPPGVERISNDQLLTSDVDVLIPAALEHQIHAENASYVRAKTIVEAANGPTTPEADEILNDRGISVVPDILAKVGGAVYIRGILS